MQSNLNKRTSKNSKYAFSPRAGISIWHLCGIYEPSQNQSMESDPIDFPKVTKAKSGAKSHQILRVLRIKTKRRGFKTL